MCAPSTTNSTSTAARRPLSSIWADRPGREWGNTGLLDGWIDGLMATARQQASNSFIHLSTNPFSENPYPIELLLRRRRHEPGGNRPTYDTPGSGNFVGRLQRAARPT